MSKDTPVTYAELQELLFRLRQVVKERAGWDHEPIDDAIVQVNLKDLMFAIKVLQELK